MRRKEKEINDEKILNEILTSNKICRIAFSSNNKPYLIPMNYGYSKNSLYLHSAKEGKKIDYIKNNNQVCFEITDSIAPMASDKICNYGTKFRSVIGQGKIHILDEREKNNAIEIIVKQQTGKIDWKINQQMLNNIMVLKIEIISITGKISGFH